MKKNKGKKENHHHAVVARCTSNMDIISTRTKRRILVRAARDVSRVDDVCALFLLFHVCKRSKQLRVVCGEPAQGGRTRSHVDVKL